MRKYAFIERYNRRLEKWEVVRLRDLLEGDIFFVYNAEGYYIVSEDGDIAFTALTDAHKEYGEWVIEYKQLVVVQKSIVNNKDR